MTKKIIKKMALACYSKNKLDSKKVNRIVKLLTRGELKIFIKALKNYENINNVTLLTPFEKEKKSLVKEIRSIFPSKKILLKQDKSLIAGIRIIDNDTIYDFNVKNTLENLISYISQ